MPDRSSPTIRDTAPPAAVEGSAMMGFPSHEKAAPSTKSIWPPMPSRTWLRAATVALLRTLATRLEQLSA